MPSREQNKRGVLSPQALICTLQIQPGGFNGEDCEDREGERMSKFVPALCIRQMIENPEAS